MSGDIAGLVEQMWNEHERDLDGTAARIVALATQVPPAQVAACAGLAEHVLVAHRGDAAALAVALDALAPVAADEEARDAVARARLAGSLLEHDVADSGGLPRANVVRAHGSAACGRAARGDAEAARRVWQRAGELARGDDAAAAKAYAACCNNLAVQLQALAPRDPALAALMMDAAAQSRSAWSRSGTWMNVERADHVLARCAGVLGDGAQAVAHARSCLAICEANGADPTETFFAHEALGRAELVRGDVDAARAQRQAMRALLDAIPDEPGLRAWARDTYDELGRSLD